MTRFRVLVIGVLVGLGASVLAVATPLGRSHDDFSGRAQIAIRDDCDPDDPGWPPPGCSLRRGDVSVAEFDEELASPLADEVIGHQAWRNDPSYLKIEEGQSVRVKNRGGRPHTFTEVAEFGGGFIPPLREGLTPAPECVSMQNPPLTLLPGESIRLRGLDDGDHRFMCCIHSWMRALIKVKPDDH
jgi:hypothetical protein